MATTSTLSRNFPTLRYLAVAVPLVLPQPSAGADPGSRAAGDARRAADLVEHPTGRPARHRRAVRRRRRSGRSRSPTTATPFVLYRRGGGSAQALGHLEPGARRQDRPACPLVAGPPGGPPLGRGEPRGDGPLSPGDRAARCARPDLALPMPDPTSWYETSISSRHWPCWRPRGWRIGATWRGAWGWYGAALRRPTTWACAGRSARIMAQHLHS